jgi:protoporphyrinogen/coproporphyrinogen III oxidase
VSTPTVVDVAIVGGGIGGLTAAHALNKRGVPFVLLEASDSFGGVIRSERESGFSWEAGPDAILAQKPEGVALCRELGLGERLVPTNPVTKAIYVLRRGRLHPLPEGMMLAVPTRVMPFLTSGLFSWPGKVRMGLDLLIPRRRENGDESIASFLRRRFGQESVDLLGEPLLAGIHSGDPERLSMRATFPRFVEMERRSGSLIRALMFVGRRPHGSPGSAFYSLDGGLTSLVQALVGRLPAPSLRPSTPVTSVGRAGETFRIEIAGHDPIDARAVVLASPPPRAAPLLGALDAALSESLSAISCASTSTVVLGYRRSDVDHPLDGYGLLVPRLEGLRTTALSFVSTKFPGRAPEGHVLLRAFLGGARDPHVLDRGDAELIEIVRNEMGPVVGLRGTPVVSRVHRWPAATPQMEVGHLERVASVEKRLAEIPGLFVTGAGLRVTGIPDVVADATRTAEAAAGYVESGDSSRSGR